MIARAYSYRSSATDARRLDAHLWKRAGQRPEIVEMRNLCVHRTAEGMGVMAALTSASRARIAFWHIYVSPRKTLTRAEAARVVELIVDELKAHDHPLMVFAHSDKPRAQRGGGANHLHIVLGHVSPISRLALDMRQHAPRIHKVMAVAAYHIEGLPVASPWHKSIIKALREENKAHVADWLIGSLGENPIINAPRMTDSMRRSAQAAGFPLPEFHADLARLWKAGAGQAEIAACLSWNGVSMERGNSVSAIALYHGKLFVGLLSRILKLEASIVYRQAMQRIPQLIRPDESNPDGEITLPDPTEFLKRSATKRNDRLKLQKRIDIVEGQLANLKTERLSLIYVPQQTSEHLQAPAVTADRIGDVVQSGSPSEARDRGQEPISARIARLFRAETILEAALVLLWDDSSWVAKSERQLMQAAQKIAGWSAENVGFGELHMQYTQGDGDSPHAPGFSP